MGSRQSEKYWQAQYFEWLESEEYEEYEEEEYEYKKNVGGCSG